MIPGFLTGIMGMLSTAIGLLGLYEVAQINPHDALFVGIMSLLTLCGCALLVLGSIEVSRTN